MPGARSRPFGFWARFLAPREIFVFWGGRFRYLSVTAWAQRMVAGGAILITVWSLAATAGHFLGQRSLASKARDLARQEHAYGALERDLAQAFENRAKLEKRVFAQEAKLKIRIEALSTALEQEKSSRVFLSDRRDALAQRIVGLETHLSNLRASEQDVMAHLSEQVLEGAAAVEKTIAMTGLNVDDLIVGLRSDGAGEAHGGLGQGGPYVPAPGGPQEEVDLAATAWRLEEQLDRWSSLREIVRRLPLGLPLDQFRISSVYGQRRDPVTRRQARHTGIDFVAPFGTPIYATSPGKVVFAGRNGRYGYMVEIDHGFGIRTRYAHLRKILVREGEEVAHRGKIGLLGSSGRSTGPHVHYEIRLQGQARNPMKYIRAGRYLFKD